MISEFESIDRKMVEAFNRLQNDIMQVFQSLDKISTSSPIDDIVYYLSAELREYILELYNDKLLVDVLEAINISVEITK